MDTSHGHHPSWSGRFIRGMVYATCLYIASLIIMPADSLGLGPVGTVLAAIAAGMALSLLVTRKKD